MRVLVDSCVIISFLEGNLKLFGKNEVEAFNSLLKQGKSDSFALEIFVNSINKIEVKKSLEVWEKCFSGFIKEVDERGIVGSSSFGDEYFGGENVAIEKKEFIERFTQSYSKKDFENNKRDAEICFLAKMLKVEGLITFDKKTIVNRHKKFLFEKGVNLMTPEELFIRLERIHGREILNGLIEDENNFFTGEI